MGRLEGKVAIVTGAVGGTGTVLVRRFATEGARVVGMDQRALGEEQIPAGVGGSALFVEADVTREEDWSRVVGIAEERFGGVDILVNNAAVLLLEAFDRTSRDDFLRVVEVNQLGPFLGMQAVFESMKKRGEGSIINVASTDGIKGMNGVAAYASSKWGLRGLTKSTAMELGRHRIRVNSICPEAGNPNMSAPFFPGNPDLSEVPHQMMQAILAAPPHVEPSSRIEDIAHLAVYLASDESRSCTAADFIIDAGLTAGHVQAGVPSA